MDDQDTGPWSGGFGGAVHGSCGGPAAKKKRGKCWPHPGQKKKEGSARELIQKLPR